MNCRKIGLERCGTIEKAGRLSNLGESSILEVMSGERVECLHGDAVIIQCKIVTKEGSRMNKRLMIGERFMPMGDNPFPCLMYYGGQTERKSGGGFVYNLHHVMSGNAAEVREMSETLRAMSDDQLKKRFSIRKMSDFQAGTVFVFLGFRAVDFVSEGEKVKSYIMKYECVQNGKTVSGEVYVPYRTYLDGKKEGTGALVYGGTRSGKASGRTYYDLKILKNVEELLELEQTL